MQLSESWLRSFVNPSLSSEALAELLTMAGLEVEERRMAAEPFSGVVVGLVKSVTKHPNADRLNVCEVDVGDGALKTIVCGAPNVAVGLKVPCALPGAELPGGFAIKVTTMRGVESGGMLCSAKELKISEESSGLMVLPESATPGQSIRELLNLDDVVLLLKMTPNRADCLSVLGVAREVSALTATPLKPVDIAPVVPTLTETIPVRIEAADLCSRFSGRVIRGVNAKAPTPAWMKERLERAGQRSISALVDISNYVMLELGRPSHVFDLDKLNGGLTVRWAQPGESLKLLNEQTVTLTGDIGVIADDTGVESLAGVMGGDSTAVSLETQNIYMECAFWWPEAIAGRARRFNFSTDAAHRFERGVDFATTVEHLERLTGLVLAICGGQAGPVTDDVTSLPERKPVQLRLGRAEKIIGMPLAEQAVADVFAKLGFAFETSQVDGQVVFTVSPPSYRFDIQIEEDLIEEIARVHGYEHLPDRPPVAAAVMQAVPEGYRSVHTLRHELAGLGYQEVVNFSFVERAWEEDFAHNPEPVRLLNPIASHLEVMRSTLLGSLVANLRHNLSHRAERVRLFEIARVFKRDAAVVDGPLTVAGFEQHRHVGGLAYGSADELSWTGNRQPVDFFDVKGDVEALIGSPCEFKPAQHPALHPGRSAQIVHGTRVLGYVGELHPKWRQKYDLPMAPVLFELDVEPLQSLLMPAYEDVSRQPVVIRDLALVVDQSVSAALVTQALQAGAQQQALWVKSLTLFDQFVPKEEGKGLNLNEKSLAFRLVLQDTESSLGDEQVDGLIKSMLASAQALAGARLR